MMNMSSSSSCYSDLVVVVNKSRNRNRNKRHKLSSPSSSSSSKSYDNYCSFFTNRNQKHQHPTPPAAAATINNNSGFFEMSLLHKNDNMNGQQQKPSPEEDTTNSLFDVATTTLTTTVPLNGGGQKNVDDVWKEIVNTSTTSFCKQEVPDEMMTLEDFLAKAAAAAPASSDEHQDVKIPIIQTHSGPIFSFDHHPTTSVNVNNKRRLLSEPLDRAAQQRQRRMIKNRESAARSRERKQAYQAELESLAVRLEEENQTLLKAKMDQTRKRYKQLMVSIIPVTEKRRPTSYVLRRVRSMEW